MSFNKKCDKIIKIENININVLNLKMTSFSNKKIKLLFACLDWRLHPEIEKYFSQNNNCDCCITAGSIKGLIEKSTRQFFLDQVSISKKLHNCQAIILTAHIDCGAYGGSAVFKDINSEILFHKEELQKAETIIVKDFPGLLIEKYIIHLEKNRNDWFINPQKLKT